MATTHPTLLDVTKRTDPHGNIDMIAEILAETNEMLTDMVWVEGNLPTGHRATVRTGYSTPTWRKLNAGVQPTKTTTAQITASCGMLEDYSEIDAALATLNGNKAAWRLSEDRGKIEGISQELASTLIYGDEASAAEEITGFAALFNDQSANNGENILTSAATPDSTDNTSIWLVVWGENTVHGIYPQGSKAGLTVSDKGQVTIENSQGASGARMEAFRTHYKWDVGLMVRDWRYVVRINYDLEDIVANGATGPILTDLMGKALRRIPNLNAGRPAFYMNRDSLDAMDLQANSKSTLAFNTSADADGRMVTRFRSVPVRRVDAILSTEAGL
jgi:hypothetical protein